MRLVIHAGTNKTGTTSLQETLLRNAELLLRHGINYPVPADGRTDHNLLTTLLVPRQHWVRGLRRAPESALQTAETLWSQIVATARAHPEAVTVISGEFLFAMPPEGWHALRQRTERAFAETHVVVYVREPAGYYLSRMQQAVKGSGRIVSPAADKYGIRNGLEAIGEAYGKALEVRAFDRTLLAEGCIVRDFLTKLPGVLPPPVKALHRNDGLPAEAACILQRFHQISRTGPEQITPASARLVRALQHLPGQTAARLRPGLSALLRAVAQPELDWLAATHGVHFPPCEEPLPETPPSAWHATDFSDLVEIDPAAVEATLYRLLGALVERPPRS